MIVSKFLAASADGRYALFKLDEYGTTDLVPGDGYSPHPLYRKDLLTGEIVRVDSLSDGSTFSSTGGDSWNATTLSLDGNVAVFVI